MWARNNKKNKIKKRGKKKSENRCIICLVLGLEVFVGDVLADDQESHLTSARGGEGGGGVHFS